MKKACLLIATLLFTIFAVGCDQTDSKVASSNLSKAADMFEINRRIVFYNGITDKYILSVEGRCSIEFHTLKFVVVCKVGPGQLKKHYLGRADNVFPFVEQLEPIDVSLYHYRVIFKPESIIPDIDLKISG